MKLCKGCKHWHKGAHQPPEDWAGYCGCPKFQEEPTGVLRDGVAYWPMYDIGAVLQTGENFGCIHWEPKECAKP